LIWATLVDRRGKAAEHPAIILTPNDQIDPDAKVVVMAVTTSFSDPPTRYHIPLPWNPDPRRVRTGLARRSAAVVNWLDTVHPQDIRRFAGDVPPKIMAAIQAELQSLS